MEIIVSGQHIATGQALQDTVRSKIILANEHYNAKMVSGQAIFSKGPRDRGFHCSLTAQAPRGVVFAAEGETQGEFVHVAFDQALVKLEKQIRRHVRERKDVSHERIVYEE